MTNRMPQQISRSLAYRLAREAFHCAYDSRTPNAVRVALHAIDTAAERCGADARLTEWRSTVESWRR